MKLDKAVVDELRVRPGEPADLQNRSTVSTTINWLGTAGKKRKEVAEEDLQSFVDELEASQELLWASGTHAVLVVLQAMDAAGKDGTIKHVMSGVNPQGCEVVAFKQPSVEELGHDFLWAAARRSPGGGGSGSSTAHTTKTSWWSGYTQSSSATNLLTRATSQPSTCGNTATRTSTPSNATGIAVAPGS